MNENRPENNYSIKPPVNRVSPMPAKRSQETIKEINTAMDATQPVLFRLLHALKAIMKNNTNIFLLNASTSLNHVYHALKASKEPLPEKTEYMVLIPLICDSINAPESLIVVSYIPSKKPRQARIQSVIIAPKNLMPNHDLSKIEEAFQLLLPLKRIDFQNHRLPLKNKIPVRVQLFCYAEYLLENREMLMTRWPSNTFKRLCMFDPWQILKDECRDNADDKLNKVDLAQTQARYDKMGADLTVYIASQQENRQAQAYALFHKDADQFRQDRPMGVSHRKILMKIEEDGQYAATHGDESGQIRRIGISEASNQDCLNSIAEIYETKFKEADTLMVEEAQSKERAQAAAVSVHSTEKPPCSAPAMAFFLMAKGQKSSRKIDSKKQATSESEREQYMERQQALHSLRQA